ncbi:MAG TPA: hypothetical protein PJ986_10585 [Gammaproteobacteria bacterium]|nr:hypothetical protein [Gammaproteobacteria bacterium]
MTSGSVRSKKEIGADQLRAATMAHSVERLRFEIEEFSALYVKRSDVEHESRDMSRIVREVLMRLPDRVVARLDELPPIGGDLAKRARAAYVLLDEECRRICNEVADEMRRGGEPAHAVQPPQALSGDSCPAP